MLDNEAIFDIYIKGDAEERSGIVLFKKICVELKKALLFLEIDIKDAKRKYLLRSLERVIFV